MAVAENQPTAERRSQFRLRIALGVAAVIFVAGLIAFWQSRTSEGPAPTVAGKGIKKSAPVQTPVLPKAGGKLPAAARAAAGRFVMATLLRKNLDAAWTLASPELRGQLTHKQWLAGTLPIPPYPVRSLASTNFVVEEKDGSTILVQAFLLPKVGAPKSFEPIRYDMTLIKRHGKWLVSYMVPYAPLGRFAAPS
jgi:hypothetical protein